jgi:hypothetical protein
MSWVQASRLRGARALWDTAGETNTGAARRSAAFVAMMA